MSIIEIKQDDLNNYIHMGIVKHPEKGRVLSDLELSVKSKFNGSKKVKTSHFINDLFANTYNMLPEHLQYQNKYSDL